MPRPGLVAILLCTLGLSACGGSTTVVTDTTPATRTAVPANPTSTATRSTTATTPTTSSLATQSGPRRCVAADLHGVFLGQQGAAGHGELGFAVRNVSSATCHTFGYPGVQFASATGAPLPTVSTRTTHDLFGTTTLHGFDLAPGEEASFRLGVDHGFAAGSRCATAPALHVIPPDDTATLVIGIPGGAYECGRATVSPLVPGRAAYP